MQVTFTGIQQSNIKSRQNSLPNKNHDIQLKDKLQGKESWLREVFRLIVVAIDELGKPCMNYRNDLDQCLTYFELLLESA